MPPSNPTEDDATQLARTSRRGPVDQTLRAEFVEPDDPVSQGLAVHPAGFGGLLSRGAVEHSGDRQEPACLRDIPGALRQPTKSLARVVRTHRKWMSHGKRPPFAMGNHCPADLGIPSESADLRVGMTRLYLKDGHEREKPAYISSGLTNCWIQASRKRL